MNNLLIRLKEINKQMVEETKIQNKAGLFSYAYRESLSREVELLNEKIEILDKLDEEGVQFLI